MRVGTPKEIKNHEYRVGLTPESVAELKLHGHEVLVETGAGMGIGATDEAYVAAGRPVEAIDFLEIGDARDTLSALQKEALEPGDAFLMRVSSGALGEDPGSELWTRLAEKA